MSGALSGVRVIEIAGLGALPYGVLKLADMGADIIRIDRVADVPADPTPRPHNFWDRGRRSVAVDLKQPDGVETVLRLAARADVFLESFRPGVVERLGIGPADVMTRNPRIVYGRLTGWGQEGPLARVAGHSLNYEALTGVTSAIGTRERGPVPTLQLLGDFAGGGLHLAFGVICALFEARRSGQGQIVDCAMIDGLMSLAETYYAMESMGMYTAQREDNLFDGGAPFYNVYETLDGKHVTVAPVEPRFYTVLLEKLGLDASDLPDQYDRTQWPVLRQRLAAVFRTRTRDEWCALLEGTDACFAPVLTFTEARSHPHNVARAPFISEDDMPQLRPAPRLSRTPGEAGPSPAWPGADTSAVLRECGFEADEIERLRSCGAVAG